MGRKRRVRSDPMTSNGEKTKGGKQVAHYRLGEVEQCPASCSLSLFLSLIFISFMPVSTFSRICIFSQSELHQVAVVRLQWSLIVGKLQWSLIVGMVTMVSHRRKVTMVSHCRKVTMVSCLKSFTMSSFSEINNEWLSSYSSHRTVSDSTLRSWFRILVLTCIEIRSNFKLDSLCCCVKQC